jgi:hypothetical protein
MEGFTMRFIPTSVHGVIDYLTAAALILLPRLFGFSDSVTSLMTFAGAGLALLSLLTRYELGPVKLIPMTGHLGLDFVMGVLLFSAPFFLLTASLEETVVMTAIGIMELALSLMTHTTPAYGYETPTIPTTERDTTDRYNPYR